MSRGWPQSPTRAERCWSSTRRGALTSGFTRSCPPTRSPKALTQYVQGARRRGLGVIIAGAGGAAHLAGAVAANTTLPVIGVPVATSSLLGLDALLATVQMPAGVPVATVAIGRGGAENAAILAAQILSLRSRVLRQRLERFKAELAEGVEGKNIRLQRKIAPESAD